jgi:hypothetical protein
LEQLIHSLSRLGQVVNKFSRRCTSLIRNSDQVQRAQVYSLVDQEIDLFS